jgi:phosphoglycolate phosphatase
MAKRGIRHSVLSASDQNHLKVQLQDYGVLKHFDFTFGIQDHYAGGKIHRGRELVEQLQVDVKDLLLIGDTNHDLEVGDALGVDVLLIAHGHQSVSRLRDVHHLVLADLDLHCLLEAMSAG